MIVLFAIPFLFLAAPVILILQLLHQYPDKIPPSLLKMKRVLKNHFE